MTTNKTDNAKTQEIAEAKRTEVATFCGKLVDDMVGIEFKGEGAIVKMTASLFQALTQGKKLTVEGGGDDAEAPVTMADFAAYVAKRDSYRSNIPSLLAGYSPKYRKLLSDIEADKGNRRVKDGETETQFEKRMETNRTRQSVRKAIEQRMMRVAHGVHLLGFQQAQNVSATVSGNRASLTFEAKKVNANGKRTGKPEPTSITTGNIVKEAKATVGSGTRSASTKGTKSAAQVVADATNAKPGASPSAHLSAVAGALPVLLQIETARRLFSHPMISKFHDADAMKATGKIDGVDDPDKVAEAFVDLMGLIMSRFGAQSTVGKFNEMYAQQKASIGNSK